MEKDGECNGLTQRQIRNKRISESRRLQRQNETPSQREQRLIIDRQTRARQATKGKPEKKIKAIKNQRQKPPY
jgi:hypothetical protein